MVLFTLNIPADNITRIFSDLDLFINLVENWQTCLRK